MALKDILLHIDHSPGYPERLELAINLARTHEAHLKGVHTISHAYYAPREGLEPEGGARQAERLFTEKSAQAGISAEWLSIDWNVVGATATEILKSHAHYTDLLIVGQPGADASEPNGSFDLTSLGLGVGCPLLVVPRTGAFPRAGSRVMIAWKSGRGALRSVNDAMPILEKSGHVNVVTVCSAGDDDGIGLNDVRSICSHLARHRVHAECERIFAGSDITVGDLLLNHAFEQKIDLLVIGAYAGSHRGGVVLSPVAKHLMNHMTVPLLISH